MNTATTRTAADTPASGGNKKFERRKDVVYKNDRVDVWATGSAKVPAGTHKSMHPMLAEKLVAKGSYSYTEVEPEGGKKARTKKVKEE